MRSVAVVGGSLAGLNAVRALRGQGFDGRVVLVSGEAHPPYDRPPLSKGYLDGSVTDADLALYSYDEDLDVDVRCGIAARTLRPGARTVELDDATELRVDGVVAATGARPRMPWADTPRGVLTLRTLDDARVLRERLRPGSRLVVVGAGFIGAEVASTATRLGVGVTLVDVAAEPFRTALGRDVAATVAGLHVAHGVRLLAGVQVTRLLGSPDVTGVQLADGRVLPADTVLVGVGVAPHTDWLADSGLDITDGVACTSTGGTALPNVVAVGDCASWYEPALGAHRRLEHWTAARERAGIAVATLLSGRAAHARPQRPQRPPYVWSDQYGHRLQVAGHTAGSDSVTVEEGTLAEHDFLAVYRRGGRPVAVAALGRPREFMRWRKHLAALAVEDHTAGDTAAAKRVAPEFASAG